MKRVIAVLMAATMLLGSTMQVFAADGLEASATGIGTLQGIERHDVVSVMLPTNVQNDLNFIMDPQQVLVREKGRSFIEKISERIDEGHYHGAVPASPDTHYFHRQANGNWSSIGDSSNDLYFNLGIGEKGPFDEDDDDKDLFDFVNVDLNKGVENITHYPDDSMVYFTRGEESSSDLHNYDMGNKYLSNTSNIYSVYNMGYSAIDVSMKATVVNPGEINVIDSLSGNYSELWAKEPCLQISAVAVTSNAVKENVDESGNVTWVQFTQDEKDQDTDHNVKEGLVSTGAGLEIDFTLQSAQEVLDSQDRELDDLPRIDYEFAGRVNGVVHSGNELSLEGLMDTPWNLFEGAEQFVTPGLDVVWNAVPHNYKTLKKAESDVDKFVLNNDTASVKANVTVPIGNVYLGMLMGKQVSQKPDNLGVDEYYIDGYLYSFCEDYDDEELVTNKKGSTVLSITADELYAMMEIGKFDRIALGYGTNFSYNNFDYIVPIDLVNNLVEGTVSPESVTINDETEKFITLSYNLPKGSDPVVMGPVSQEDDTKFVEVIINGNEACAVVADDEYGVDDFVEDYGIITDMPEEDLFDFLEGDEDDIAVVGIYDLDNNVLTLSSALVAMAVSHNTLDMQDTGITVEFHYNKNISSITYTLTVEAEMGEFAEVTIDPETMSLYNYSNKFEYKFNLPTENARFVGAYAAYGDGGNKLIPEALYSYTEAAGEGKLTFTANAVTNILDDLVEGEVHAINVMFVNNANLFYIMPINRSVCTIVVNDERVTDIKLVRGTTRYELPNGFEVEYIKAVDTGVKANWASVSSVLSTSGEYRYNNDTEGILYLNPNLLKKHNALEIKFKEQAARVYPINNALN